MEGEPVQEASSREAEAKRYKPAFARKYCSAQYNVKENFELHMEREHKARKCDRCQLCLIPRLLRTHICAPVVKPIRCVACDYTCSVSSNMKRHYDSKHSFRARLALAEQRKQDAAMERRLRGRGEAALQERKKRRMEKELRMKRLQRRRREKQGLQRSSARALERSATPAMKSFLARKTTSNILKRSTILLCQQRLCQATRENNLASQKLPSGAPTSATSRTMRRDW